LPGAGFAPEKIRQDLNLVGSASAYRHVHCSSKTPLRLISEPAVRYTAQFCHSSFGKGVPVFDKGQH